MTIVLRDTYSHNGRYYFTLKLKPPLQNMDENTIDDMSEPLTGPMEQRDSLINQDIETE